MYWHNLLWKGSIGLAHALIWEVNNYVYIGYGKTKAACFPCKDIPVGPVPNILQTASIIVNLVPRLLPFSVSYSMTKTGGNEANTIP